MATQLAGRAQQADLASAQASAAFAVSQALRVLDGPRKREKSAPVDLTDLPVWGASVEIDTYTGETRRTNWSAHPYCTCRGTDDPREGG